MSDDNEKGQSGNTEQESNSSAEDSGKPAKKLDSLLAEWGGDSKGTDGGKPEKGKPSGDDKIAERVERLEALLTRTSYDTDMKSVVAEVKGDLDVDDWIVESWVNRKADSDPRLVALWEERDEKKSQFREVITSMVPEFQAYAKDRLTKKDDPKDDTKDDDDKGLSAAVRNSREAKPDGGFDDTNWATLSPADFALKSAEVFRAAASGKLK